MKMDIEGFIISELTSSASLMNKMAGQSVDQIRSAAIKLSDRLAAGNKVLLFGNGGSAADAQHFASELLGRYRRERHPYPAIALTTDPSTMTSIGNDSGFGQVFARQVQAFAQPGDVVVGISTSGRSENVLAGLKAAKKSGAHTIALVGADTGKIAALADILISIPNRDTPRIQEMHSVIIHILCDIIEQNLVEGQR